MPLMQHAGHTAQMGIERDDKALPSHHCDTQDEKCHAVSLDMS